MTKKVINQKGKFDEELINTIEPNFVFKNKPINRFNFTESDEEESQSDKAELLNNLEKKINSIENCNLKDNSKNIQNLRNKIKICVFVYFCNLEYGTLQFLQ